jgi:hypothetical protein
MSIKSSNYDGVAIRTSLETKENQAQKISLELSSWANEIEDILI